MAKWRLDNCEVVGQTIRLQAIPARMTCDHLMGGLDSKCSKSIRMCTTTASCKEANAASTWV